MLVGRRVVVIADGSEMAIGAHGGSSGVTAHRMGPVSHGEGISIKK